MGAVLEDIGILLIAWHLPYGSRDNLQTSYRLDAQGLDVPPPSLAHKTSPSAAFASNGRNLASTDVSHPAEFLSRAAQGSSSRSPFASDGMR